MARRRTILTTGAGVLTGAALTACSSGSGGGKSSNKGADAPKASPTCAAKVTITPAADAKDISPADPVAITADGGTLQSVTVAGEDGKQVTGALDADKRTWKSSATLGYGKKYTVTVTAADSAGLQVQQTSTFATVTPTATATITFQANSFLVLKPGDTYGVGQPVCVAFSKSVKNRDAAIKGMVVTTEPPVEGRWRWIDPATAHWRPAEYWAAHTKVSVKINLFGVDLGNGTYGGPNASTNFVIGPSQIAKVDSNTHHMLVYFDGKQVKDFPVSLGQGGTTKGSDGQTVNFATTSGKHVILNKEDKVSMSSASYGVTDKNDKYYYDPGDIHFCCRITQSGEFVHLADWASAVNAMGSRNVSHGCINVGPNNAQWFYENFRIGDVVEVINTGYDQTLTNGIGDWNVPWAQW